MDCLEPLCDGKAHARGLCDAHYWREYRRFRRTGRNTKPLIGDEKELGDALHYIMDGEALTTPEERELYADRPFEIEVRPMVIGVQVE